MHPTLGHDLTPSRTRSLQPPYSFLAPQTSWDLISGLGSGIEGKLWHSNFQMEMKRASSTPGAQWITENVFYVRGAANRFASDLSFKASRGENTEKGNSRVDVRKAVFSRMQSQDKVEIRGAVRTAQIQAGWEGFSQRHRGKYLVLIAPRFNCGRRQDEGEEGASDVELLSCLRTRRKVAACAREEYLSRRPKNSCGQLEADTAA
ncbi:hypothetical protein B0H11DRAFT_1930495 [Mycena galericulata]|nr:hypothetical protein B0H11DRAFT_1930495 [Mycena galericulata]